MHGENYLKKFLVYFNNVFALIKITELQDILQNKHREQIWL